MCGHKERGRGGGRGLVRDAHKGVRVDNAKKIQNECIFPMSRCELGEKWIWVDDGPFRLSSHVRLEWSQKGKSELKLRLVQILLSIRIGEIEIEFFKTYQHSYAQDWSLAMREYKFRDIGHNRNSSYYIRILRIILTGKGILIISNLMHQ